MFLEGQHKAYVKQRDMARSSLQFKRDLLTLIEVIPHNRVFCNAPDRLTFVAQSKMSPSMNCEGICDGRLCPLRNELI